jgi:hypothetical protein
MFIVTTRQRLTGPQFTLLRNSYGERSVSMS